MASQLCWYYHHKQKLQHLRRQNQNTVKNRIVLVYGLILYYLVPWELHAIIEHKVCTPACTQLPCNYYGDGLFFCVD